jgi:hypothetical protein
MYASLGVRVNGNAFLLEGTTTEPTSSTEYWPATTTGVAVITGSDNFHAPDIKKTGVKWSYVIRQ